MIGNAARALGKFVGNNVKETVVKDTSDQLSTITSVIGAFVTTQVKDKLARTITFSTGESKDNGWMEKAFYAIIYKYNNIKKKSSFNLTTYDGSNDTSVYYQLADGFHHLRYRNYRIIVHIKTTDVSVGRMGSTAKAKIYTISTFDLSTKFVTQFEKDMVYHRDDLLKFKTDRNVIDVFTDGHENDGWTYWIPRGTIPKRKLSTVYLEDDVKTTVVDTINNFFNEKQWYKDRGISHNLKILLYGDTAPQPNSTIIPTTTGLCKLGDLKIGDYVFDRTGKPTKVLGVFSRGSQEIFEIKFNDGRIAKCTKDHLWTVYGWSHGNRVTKTLPLKQIMKEFSERLGGRIYALPMNGPAQYPPTRVPVDPYTLGILLTDGCLCDKYLRISQPTDEIPRILSERNNIRYRKRSYSEHEYGYYFEDLSGKLIKTEDFLKDVPELIGVLGPDKSIPESYLYNDIRTRKELLRGMMDGDGSISLRPGRAWPTPDCRLTTTSRKMADQVQWLCRSLGYKSRRIMDNRPEKYRGGFCASITVTPPPDELIELFAVKKKVGRARTSARLYHKLIDERKNSGCKRNNYQDFSHSMITCIRSLGIKEQVSCIVVDNEENLYQTEDFVVTHNCGKDSLAKAIASEWHRNIFYVTGGKNGRFVPDALTSHAPFIISPLFIISDIDRYPFLINDELPLAKGTGEDKIEENKLSFAKMINALDGIMSGDDRIIVMTTNHIEKFSPTFLRPGRINLAVELKRVTPEVFRRFTLDFYNQVLPKTIKLRRNDIAIPELQADVVFRKMNFDDFLKKYTTTRLKTNA